MRWGSRIYAKFMTDLCEVREGGRELLKDNLVGEVNMDILCL